MQRALQYIALLFSMSLTGFAGGVVVALTMSYAKGISIEAICPLPSLLLY